MNRVAVLKSLGGDFGWQRRLSRCSASLKRPPTTLESLTPLLVTSGVVAASLLIDPSHAVAAVDGVSPESHGVAHEVYQLAENEDFWANMARYSRFFVSVMVGSAYIILKPFAQLLKKPVTAAVFIGGAVVFYFFISTTLKGMLGLDGTEF